MQLVSLVVNRGYLASPRIAGASVFAVFVIGVLLLAIWQDKQENHRISELVDNELAEVVSLVKTDLQSRFHSLRRMADRWVVNGGTPQNAFISDALGYVADQPGFLALEWVDNKFYVRWVAPLKGNEQAVDLFLAKEERRRSALEKARNNRSVTLSKPIELVQGGTGFLGYVPIFIGEKFDGFILAVFHAEKWLTQVFNEDRLTEKNNSVSYFHVQLSFGEDLIFDNHISDDAVSYTSVSDQFTFGGQVISVKLSPSQRFIESQASPLKSLIVIVGLLVGAALGISVGALLTSHDAMASQKRTEDELRLSESRHTLLVQSQTDLICRFSPIGVINFANNPYMEFVGKDVKELIGRSIYDDVPQNEHEGMRKYFSKLNIDNPSSSIENLNINNLGEERLYEWINHAYFDSDGGVTEIQSVGRDITEVRQARDRAEAANRAKSDFLSTMSHEIRTPLNGVLGIAQLLKDTKLDEDQASKVNTILSSGETLLAIISDILDMSKIEAGGLELEQKSFSLSGLVSTIITPFESLANDKGIELVVSYNIAPGMIIKGDAVRLRQILWNLMSNAIKFTDQGRIIFKVEAVRNTQNIGAQVASPKEHLLSFAVGDTGTGIAPDRLDAIFDAFAQEDNSITRKHGGTGLGLSIVNQLTELMGGTINVESKLGKGSSFIAYIPFSAATEEEVKTVSLRASNTAYQNSEPLNILIAEDNKVNAVIAKAFLEKFGHSVKHVVNGRLAVEAAKDGWADLILMDIHMPEMNGIDATMAIHATEIGKNIPIIGLTAEAFAERHALFIEAGMIDVLTKPYTAQQLADTLAANRLIDRRSKSRATHLSRKKPM